MNCSAGPHLRVPVGDDAHRWSTFRTRKTLVVAARTVTSTVRVLEALPAVLRGDSRVAVVFAYDPTSAFNGGVLDLLHDAGCRVMPWTQLPAIEPDLILSASENIDVPEGDCPVLVLPHGIGFQKLVPDSRAQRTRLSGVVPDSLIEAGRAWLAVSHPDQEKQLLALQPKVSGHTLLTGDPCFDELAMSLRHAAAFKQALGVAEERRLLVISSTWGPTSALGRDPGLPARLLAQLPYDGYQVGLILHPNVWSAHGEWQIRTLLADALDAGLTLIPPVHEWRPALVAADAVVGDHGSVTLYAAALGKPVLLAAFGSDSVPGTAIARLGQDAPRLSQHGDMYRQIEAAVTAHVPDRYAEVSRLAFAEPGQALARLRTAVYRLLKLAEPEFAPPPQPTLLPRPNTQATAVTSWIVETTAAEPSVINVRRHPAAVCADRTEGTDAYLHLACDEDERDQRLTESASILLRHHPAPTAGPALRWTQDTLNRFPGARLAAVALAEGGFLMGLRDGRTIEATVTGAAADPGLPAAVLYTCLRAGLPFDRPRGVVLAVRTCGVRNRAADVGLRVR